MKMKLTLYSVLGRSLGNGFRLPVFRPPRTSPSSQVSSLQFSNSRSISRCRYWPGHQRWLQKTIIGRQMEYTELWRSHAIVPRALYTVSHTLYITENAMFSAENLSQNRSR